MSVVIPALNEAERLPPFLTAVRRYFGKSGLRYEVVVVDDGSRDGTAAVVETFRRDWPALRLLRHPHNCGKGAALRTGIEAAQGRLILLTDADGATPIEEEAKLRAALASRADIAVGSRLLWDDATHRHRKPVRGLLGKMFATCATRALRLPVTDPQCGFKLLRAEAVAGLLSGCVEPGYLFDAELLLHASRQGLRIADVPVSWREVPGSKVSRYRDGGRMLWGLARLRRAGRSS